MLTAMIIRTVVFATFSGAVALSASCGGAQSPSTMCTHVQDVTGEIKDDNDRKKCVREFEGIKAELTEDRFKSFSSCVMDASNKSSILDCAQKALQPEDYAEAHPHGDEDE